MSGGRDYVGSMYQAYRGHLRGAGIRKLPCRTTFHKYVRLLKETGALVFDGAQAISFSIDPPAGLPAGYQPDNASSSAAFRSPISRCRPTNPPPGIG